MRSCFALKLQKRAGGEASLTFHRSPDGWYRYEVEDTAIDGAPWKVAGTREWESVEMAMAAGMARWASIDRGAPDEFSDEKIPGGRLTLLDTR